MVGPITVVASSFFFILFFLLLFYFFGCFCGCWSFGLESDCVIQLSLLTCSPGAVEAAGIGSQGKNGFIAADIERSSLILCGKAFSDTNGIKTALAALCGPIISARGGLPLSAR